MRPLFFEEPENKALTTVCESYLWGNDFLVTPITKAGVTSASVYFPKNNNWFDFYSNQKYEAGTTQNIAVTEDHIPVFVRGGAFIPMIKTIQNTTKYSLSNFDLHYYFDAKTTSSSGKLYNDDGTTANDFEKGQYEILNFKANTASNILTIDFISEIGKSYTATDKNVNLLLHNLNSKVQKVTLNGNEVTFKNNNNTIEIPVTWKKATAATIKIQF